MLDEWIESDLPIYYTNIWIINRTSFTKTNIFIKKYLFLSINHMTFYYINQISVIFQYFQTNQGFKKYLMTFRVLFLFQFSRFQTVRIPSFLPAKFLIKILIITHKKCWMNERIQIIFHSLLELVMYYTNIWIINPTSSTKTNIFIEKYLFLSQNHMTFYYIFLLYKPDLCDFLMFSNKPGL